MKLNNGAKCAIAFVLGAAAGAVVSWKMLEAKYKQIADEEIESMELFYADKYGEELPEEEPETEPEEPVTMSVTKEKPNIREYAAQLKEQGYIDYTDAAAPKKEESNLIKPYVIRPDEYGETGYEIRTLTYYSDMVLYDDDDELVEDVENVVGLDTLSHFGDYEEDVVHVRNDELQVDYEIFMDHRNSTDVINLDPYPPEDR